ncbi:MULTISPECIES: hypothetical protein [unclassified Streptomyces]|uniref:hypothetical protein n=1 Tax=unclassified Streptomyces TaxID=2593676 RepID=UPI0029B0C9FE|nr:MULTISPECIES: hypothetical protein [unclassified Streptomyces]MDX3771922.1 hypothetical protein [Streptomyces sp. AK08-01B]MDX3821398.1 hypothetical protein [Streptomyces sp. AK08-01A]
MAEGEQLLPRGGRARRGRSAQRATAVVTGPATPPRGRARRRFLAANQLREDLTAELTRAREDADRATGRVSTLETRVFEVRDQLDTAREKTREAEGRARTAEDATREARGKK